MNQEIKKTINNYRVLNRLNRALIIVFGILFIDQAIKFWIKTHMYIGQEYHIFGNWFIIHFLENNGMAFGMELQFNYGKFFLSLIRVLAVSAIGWYLWRLIKEKAPLGWIHSLAVIFAGAIGNIIDSLFYGLIFNSSDFQIAKFMPTGGGYASFLHGKVVDMLYFPIIDTRLPSWFPFMANEQFTFFQPVFNIADTAITVGVLMLIIFNRDFFNTKKEKITVQ